MSKQEFYILLNRLAIRDTEGIIESGLSLYRKIYERLPFYSSDTNYYELFRVGILAGKSIKDIFNTILVDLQTLETSARYGFYVPEISQLLKRTGRIKKTYCGYFTQREFLIRFGVRDIDRFIAINNFPLTAKILMQGHSELFIYLHNEKSKQKHT